MSVNLNMDKKLRVGGRKAPQMSIEDFTALLKSWLLKGHCDDDDLDQRLYLTLNEGQRDEKVFRDILKIEVDFSNVELEDILMKIIQSQYTHNTLSLYTATEDFWVLPALQGMALFAVFEAFGFLLLG